LVDFELREGVLWDGIGDLEGAAGSGSAVAAWVKSEEEEKEAHKSQSGCG